MTGSFTTVLARRRVPLGFLGGIVVFWLAQPTGRSLAMGAAVAMCGEAIRIWAAGHLRKSREVTIWGPYRYVAHPLDMGSSIMGVGLGLATNSVAAFSVIVFYLAVTIGAAVRTEEAFLRSSFGEDYARYHAGAVGGASEDRLRRFSLRLAIANREHRALAGLALTVLLLALKATYNGTFWGAAGGP